MRRSLTLVVLAVALGALSASVATATSDRTAHDCVRGNELWFRAADGVQLVGHRFGGLRPGAKPAVVLAHQSNGSLCEWLPEARRLAARGIWVFAFDFRGHGFSKGRVQYGRLAIDYAAAVRAARALGARNVVLAGASLGGIAAVVAGASIRPAVAGIVAVSAPAAIAGRIDAGPFAPRLRVPALYVAALEDRNEPYDFAADAQRLHDATGSTTKRLELVAGTDHGVRLVERSAGVRALLERFVRDPPSAVGA
jgi:pimeloyl-ACP methyl ester carboxylesterase